LISGTIYIFYSEMSRKSSLYKISLLKIYAISNIIIIVGFIRELQLSQSQGPWRSYLSKWIFNIYSH